MMKERGRRKMEGGKKGCGWSVLLALSFFSLSLENNAPTKNRKSISASLSIATGPSYVPFLRGGRRFLAGRCWCVRGA